MKCIIFLSLLLFMIIFVLWTCPYTEYVVSTKYDKSFHIVLCEDKLFLPYYLCSIDTQTIMEYINFSISPYIFDDFYIRDIPIYNCFWLETINHVYIILYEDKSYAIDTALLYLFALSGNLGAVITGFDMTIIYLFFWKISVLAGDERSFTYYVFIQALTLLPSQPILFYKAKICKHDPRQILLYFVPMTVL